jgi:hypothetical protein
MKGRRALAATIVGLFILAACGGADAPNIALAPIPAAAPAPDAPSPPANAEADESQASAPSPAASNQVEAPAGSSPQAPPAEATAPGTAAAETVAASAAWPTDGCSLDNAATTPDIAVAPAPPLSVRAESIASPLPDLAVRRINCAGGWVNLKNELPSVEPLLVWFWAPH